MIRAALALILVATPVQASSLYEATTPVTGTDGRNRQGALTDALAQVLAKVSGNPALAHEPRVTALGPTAPGMVANLAYLDRMANLPKQDEQGSRDRPYDLVVRFDPASIDAALAALGEAPWPAIARPGLAIAIAITPWKGSPFPLQADTLVDEGHRAALLAAAERYGLPIVLPISDSPHLPATVSLDGTIGWSDRDAGWVGTWTLAWQGHTHQWSIAGVGFDEAYRNALAGAASILSGHTP